MNYRLTIQYDGTDFHGWQAQGAGERTVQGEVARALSLIEGRGVVVHGAGRTDAGVHALGQVVSFSADTGFTPGSISYRATAVLPDDLALRRCVAVREGFDARRDARTRSYEYRILNDPIRSPLARLTALHVPKELHAGLLRKAAAFARGEHDFRAFTPAKSHHVRFARLVEESAWEERGGLLVYRITANSFLYGMVRALVGTMLEIADGRGNLADFSRLLEGGERSEAGPAAPARGLTLVYVSYDDLTFGGTA